MPAEPVAMEWAGARAADDAATFRVADPERALAGVRLLQDLPIAADRLEFSPVSGGWQLILDRPPVARLEYLLELRYPGGDAKVVTDPANPRSVPGAFGPKSVLEFPGYAPPAWLSVPADPGTTASFHVPGPGRRDLGPDLVPGRVSRPRDTSAGRRARRAGTRCAGQPDPVRRSGRRGPLAATAPDRPAQPRIAEQLVLGQCPLRQGAPARGPARDHRAGSCRPP